jgi:hypothetical protein
MKWFARNAARISILAIYSGAAVLPSAYSEKAGFITLSDFDNTTVVADLNDLGAPTPNIFATPLKVGIYLFTTDSGQLGYGTSGLNNSNALSTTTDLGWMRIEISPSAQVTKFGFLLVSPDRSSTITKPCSFSTTTITCSGARVCHAVVGFSSLLSRILRDWLVAYSSKMPT